ncbi:MAG TPA: putative O-glycosylation ligase, exosortase A system-associated [Candidatus Eisenbacteria bacterium]|nr:putative O-glycosylation ligase, exosortase A system-associated [Candidatus Eisenbacteria bacterium]
MRDLILLAVLVACIPISFLKPYIGIYVWYWIGFMNPHRFTYGFMYSFPVAMGVGAATIAGSFLVRRKAPLLRSPEMVILLILAALFTVNTLFALFPSAWKEWDTTIKVLIMTFFTVVLIDTREKLRYLVIVTVVSIGLVAAKGAIWGMFTSAQYRLWGPAGSFLEDNNSMALALNMLLPIALFLAKTEPKRMARLFFFGMFLCCMFSVFLTYSRGGLLGLVAVISMLVYRARRNIWLMLATVAVFGTILAFIPSHWYDRMKTIQTYEQDESAQSRLQTWGFAWELALDRPLTGGGFEGFRANPSDKNPHSIYFGILGEQGFIALGFFIALLISCQLSLGRMEREAKRRPELRWYGDLAAMLRISLIGYMVSGAFLNLQYFDFFYLVVGFVAIMRYLLPREPVPSEAAEPVRARRPVRWGPERAPQTTG